MAKTDDKKKTQPTYRAPQGLTMWDGDEYNRHLAESQRARGERVNVPEFRVSKGYRHTQQEPEVVDPIPQAGVERTEGGATVGIEGGAKGLDLSEFGGGEGDPS